MLSFFFVSTRLSSCWTSYSCSTHAPIFSQHTLFFLPQYNGSHQEALIRRWHSQICFSERCLQPLREDHWEECKTSPTQQDKFSGPVDYINHQTGESSLSQDRSSREWTLFKGEIDSCWWLNAWRRPSISGDTQVTVVGTSLHQDRIHRKINTSRIENGLAWVWWAWV